MERSTTRGRPVENGHLRLLGMEGRELFLGVLLSPLGPNSASPSLTGYRLEVGFEPATSSQETPLLAPRLEVINR